MCGDPSQPPPPQIVLLLILERLICMFLVEINNRITSAYLRVRVKGIKAWSSVDVSWSFSMPNLGALYSRKWSSWFGKSIFKLLGSSLGLELSPLKGYFEIHVSWTPVSNVKSPNVAFPCGYLSWKILQDI